MPVLQPGEIRSKECAQEPLISFVKNDVRLADTYYKCFFHIHIYNGILVFINSRKKIKIYYNYFC